MMIYDWYGEFFLKKVMPGFLREMAPCVDGDGFYSWLETTDRAAYDELTLLDETIASLWRLKGDRNQFREVCQKWVGAHLRLKPRYLSAMSPEMAQRELL